MGFTWMIKMKLVYQFLLSLEVFKVVGEVPHGLGDHILWSKFIHLIVLILAIKHVIKSYLIILSLILVIWMTICMAMS